jgi:hypothetical protein
MLFKKIPLQDMSDADQELTPMYSRHVLNEPIPRYKFPSNEILPQTAYSLIHDELMLEGNSRLNLATFVTTWMEPEARLLMSETFDKNMIDKDEYPQTAALEMRCVNMLAHLWNSPLDTPALSGMGRKKWAHARLRSSVPTPSPFGGAFCVGTLKTPLVSQVMFSSTRIAVGMSAEHVLNPCTDV